MPYCFAALAELSPAIDLPVPEFRFLNAARAWAAAARSQHNPRRAVDNALGESGCAGPFCLFVEQLVSSFSAPFLGGDLDCLAVLPDEMLLIRLLSAAGDRDRAQFDSFLLEMIAEARRETLYGLARRVHERMVAGYS